VQSLPTSLRVRPSTSQAHAKLNQGNWTDQQGQGIDSHQLNEDEFNKKMSSIIAHKQQFKVRLKQAKTKTDAELANIPTNLGDKYPISNCLPYNGVETSLKDLQCLTSGTKKNNAEQFRISDRDLEMIPDG
jgi:hypothetical protein